MLNHFKDMLSWLRGTDAPEDPEQAAMSGLMRLVALNALSNIQEARQKAAAVPESLPEDADETSRAEHRIDDSPPPSGRAH